MNAPIANPDAMAAFSAALGSASFRGVSVLNSDCMAVMSKLTDKSYDLAICDPPYGIGAAGKKQYHAGALSVKSPLDL